LLFQASFAVTPVEILILAPVSNATAYDIVRGSLNELHTSGGNFTMATKECLGNNIAATLIAYSTNPSVGQGFWIVVRGVNCGGSGSYNEFSGSQIGDRDAEIAASIFACP
jgi:hypothetical protein